MKTAYLVFVLTWVALAGGTEHPGRVTPSANRDETGRASAKPQRFQRGSAASHPQQLKRPSIGRQAGYRPVPHPSSTGSAASLSAVRHRGPNPAVVAGSAGKRNSGAIDGRQVHRQP